ncbi:DUF4082 domain-containing protein [Lentzea sp. NPDC042327]|uniref:DUF4082 domain-containing protein n=1 Tax=Lentzea sp. NPDC042327 TaxID=3154801 RepID=UPI00340DD812
MTAALLAAAGSGPLTPTLPQSHLCTPTDSGHDGYRSDTLRDFQVPVDGGQTWRDEYRTATVPLGGETGVEQAFHTIVSHVVTSWNHDKASRVRLWRGDGTLLADQAVPGAYADAFATPVPVVPGVEYVASLTSRHGLYRASTETFPATVVRAPFVLPAHAGVYSYDDGFPTETWRDSHYWVAPELQA